MNTIPTPYYVLLNRSAVPSPLWTLTVRVDRTGWQSAADRPYATLTATLDDAGFVDAGEQARLVQWLGVALGREIVLNPLPGTYNVFQVAYAPQDEQ